MFGNNMHLDHFSKNCSKNRYILVLIMCYNMCWDWRDGSTVKRITAYAEDSGLIPSAHV